VIRGRHPRYSGPEFDAAARAIAHHPMQGPPDPKWNRRPNFEGIGEDEDPDAYDREKDRRLTGEIP